MAPVKPVVGPRARNASALNSAAAHARGAASAGNRHSGMHRGSAAATFGTENLNSDNADIVSMNSQAGCADPANARPPTPQVGAGEVMPVFGHQVKVLDPTGPASGRSHLRYHTETAHHQFPRGSLAVVSARHRHSGCQFSGAQGLPL